MTGPQQLSRPLAQRVAGLPAPSEHEGAGTVSAAIAASVAAAAAEALDKGKTHYTDRPGILPLREQAVAGIGRQSGVEIGADEVTITCGATEARFVALKQLVSPGSQVLCVGDGAPIAGAAALIGAGLTHDPAADGIALVYLTPNDSPDAVRAALDAVRGRESVWIVWDMAAGTGSGQHPAHDPALAPRTITIGSVSDQLPGWRVGWLAGSKAANKLRAYKQSMTICTSSISQWAALGLEDGST